MAALTTTGVEQFVAPTSTTTRAPKGIFARFLASVQEARMRQAEREIARFIEVKGGRLTDDVERQIERNFI